MNDTPEKFLFDLNDFSNEKPVNAEEEEKSFSEEELNSAREESFRLGVHDATQKIRNEHEERSIQTQENLTQQLVTLLEAEQRREIEKSLDTAKLVLSIVKKMMPGLSRKYGEDEIISLVRQSLSDRADEPRIVLSVHESMLETMRGKIDNITQSQAYQGSVVIIADDNLSVTDCRVEWADGGIEKDFDRLYASIDKAFQQVVGRLETPSSEPPVQTAETHNHDNETEMTKGE
mgnify:CR=1 FL=1